MNGIRDAFAGVFLLTMVAESAQDSPSKDIYGKWLPLRYEHGFDYSMLWQVLAVFTVILLALVLWNRKLIKEIKDRKRAEAALQQQTSELATLHALGRSVNATLTMEGTTKLALEGMLQRSSR